MSRFVSGLLLFWPLALQAQATPFRPGMIVSSSVRIAPGTYQVAPGEGPAITVRGDSVTLDLRGVELVGNPDRQRPDRFTGIAVLVDSGSAVTVRGARIRGFKVGILARGTRGLRLLGNDLSDNYRPRLYSRIEHESLADWLSYHHNEDGEWLRYGAGIYLEGVSGGEIRGNTVERGMNGLMLTRTSGIGIWDNNFSFNSGVGIGLDRSTQDTIVHNRADWNVRGYSHGFFNRGQDSAALLMFEQASGNWVLYNSMTHSGDGLFLWAGQSTMDSGTGGSNDNLFFGNDFSFAPTNGMEATFSRNFFYANRVEGAWHGLWGGYSWESKVIGNQFSRNVEAIAIEHGQNNQITGNTFDQDTTAIHLWWNQLEPSDWGYPKHRDTRSRDYQVSKNRFLGVRTALRIQDTQELSLDSNVVRDVDTLVVAKGDTSGWQGLLSRRDSVGPTTPVLEPYSLSDGQDVLGDSLTRRGRETIIITEWGPYTWRYPLLWPVGRSDTVPLRLRVLGPPGRWRVLAGSDIASLSEESGTMGDTITVIPAAGHETDFSLDLEYRGAATVSQFGERHRAGEPVRFGWQRFQPATTWHLTFIPTDTSARNADTTQLRTLLARPPVAMLDTNDVDLMWARPPIKLVPAESILTVATATITLPEGRYTLRTIADDAIRVWVDDRLVLDDWVPGDSHVMEVELPLAGTHTIRAVHLQLDGWYEMRVEIRREDGKAG
ncbi:MAG TPA: right-handed parallel beta-helix repeat-containing protein [Gemmatimonadales bacterium]|nr:right-handed parallel beta-helix repeat-containing protein [Gemmatimonadales bacterium]